MKPYSIRSLIQVTGTLAGLALATSFHNHANAQAVTKGSGNIALPQIDQIVDDLNNGLLSEASRQGLSDAFGKAATSNGTNFLFDRSGLSTRWVIGGGASAGLGSPYGLQFKKAIDGLQANSDNALPAVGANIQAALQVAVKGPWLGIPNIGPFKSERLMVSVSGGGYKYDSDKASFQMLNLGVGARYHLIEGVGTSYLARWNGVYVGFGMTYTKNEAAINYDIHQVKDEGGPAETTLDMPFTAKLNTSNFVVPIEVSTSAQLLYALSFHLGGAADFNFGSSKLSGESDGVANGPLGTTQNIHVDLAANGISGKIPTLVGRGFFGFDLNLYAVKIGIQGSALSNGAYNVGTMLRFSM